MAQKSSRLLSFKRKLASFKSSKDDSSTDHSWHKGSQDLGELPKEKYEELQTELESKRRGQGYDLCWNTTKDGKIKAKVSKNAPTDENQQSKGQGSAMVTFDKSDLSNPRKWKILMDVKQYDDEAGRERDMGRRGSVQNNQPKEMPELNENNLL